MAKVTKFLATKFDKRCESSCRRWHNNNCSKRCYLEIFQKHKFAQNLHPVFSMVFMSVVGQVKPREASQSKVDEQRDPYERNISDKNLEKKVNCF